MGEYRLDLLDRIDALDGLLADAQSEAKSHADAAANYARELTEARALVRELVEAGKELYGAHWQTWCGDPHTTPEQMAEDEAHFATFDEVKRWEAALTRAREAGYGKEAE